DIFPLPSSEPYRIELFDVEVDSIRTFDVTNQRSIDKKNTIMIPPAKEIIAQGKRFQEAAELVYDRLQEQLNKMTDRQAKERLDEEIRGEIERLRERVFFPGLYKYISLLYPEQHTLL